MLLYYSDLNSRSILHNLTENPCSVDVKFNVDRFCRDMYDILTFMRASDRPESKKSRK